MNTNVGKFGGVAKVVSGSFFHDALWRQRHVATGGVGVVSGLSRKEKNVCSRYNLLGANS